MSAPVEEIPSRDGGAGPATAGWFSLPMGGNWSLDAEPPESRQLSLPQNIVSLRIDPADAVIDVARGQSTTVNFRAWAKLQGSPNEIEITPRTVFYVPDRYLVGCFPPNGGPAFTTHVPRAPGAPPQRGGKVTIQALAANTDLPITVATTSLTVRIIDTAVAPPDTPMATPAIPANPGSLFRGSEKAELAPVLVYPNSGVMLPPNMRSFEIHYLPGSQSDELYEIAILGKYSQYRFYTRCYAHPSKFIAGTCAFELDPDAVDVIAESNRGEEPVLVQVSGASGDSWHGKSAVASVSFASDRVDGALYYWTTSDPPRIVRFDFGSQSGLAPVLEPSDLPDDSVLFGRPKTCVGCHMLSRDGARMVASTGSSWEGYLVYINDLSRPKTDPSWLTVDGRSRGVASQNRVLAASFDPSGSQFVSVAPASDTTLGATKLAFHDAISGLRQSTLDVGFKVTYPDWSPDGESIALTRITGSDNATIAFQEAGISLIRRTNNGWSLPAVDIIGTDKTKSRYTPNFVPDSSFLLYAETVRQAGDTTRLTDGYSDPSATVWAVIPQAGASPVPLSRANAPGIADSLSLADRRSPTLVKRLASGQLMNTFPRAAPFSSKQNGRTLFWFTIASQRRAGVRLYVPNDSVVGDSPTQTLLWMFALDGDAVLSGQDGSFPGFFLPFQDMGTSNHLASWTQKYVSDNPPPPPPPVPSPPPLLILPPIP